MILRKRRRRAADMSLAELTSRIRGFIYDSQVNEAETVAKYLGCPEISDEVFDAEITASDVRVSKVAHLTSLLYVFAHAMAEGVIEAQRDQVGEEAEIPPEVWATTRKVFSEMATNTLIGSISQLVDMGILSINKRGKR